MTMSIVYQDDDLLAVHKPPGLLVHRSLIDKHETRFAMQMARDMVGKHVFPVHRLDRPTSGILLFALSSDVARLLTEQFTAQQVDKTYYAIVRGHPDEQGHIDYALKEKLDKIADKMANQDKPAQQAQTDYSRLATFELPHPVGRYASARYALMRLSPHTGRKHQLRRHMAHISHPILGDTTHGDGKHNKFVRQTYGFNGLALTCQQMVLQHPVQGGQLVLRGEFDERLVKLLGQWGMSRAELRQLEND
ncbi:tRNA pseudouridine(65) synthase TruC [Aestuariibacter halophilus]|uniref:tRNA pseudouridine synthase C n=1 Tax=Fluctibacter halophilus TaxID=226011 RepID=A0ABS8GC59_9ALTE|nr:tRNA pseudouridine(65) synthase TruC [Aestuariibacter halophilus]MCC2618157.1 tRNA pseudouridine(65) synthase TruC [Aestuariibacter halophilus]